MICQVCGQRTATTHIKTLVNGQLTEAHLCAECAQKKGYSSMLSSWNGFGSLLGGLLGEVHPQEIKRCPGCGASFREISQTGKIGCAQCYSTFRSQLLPVIQRIHGAAQHKGKMPGGSALRVAEPNHQLVAVEESPMEEKKRLLKRAIEAQDFEQAAVLRDQIKEMERNG